MSEHPVPSAPSGQEALTDALRVSFRLLRWIMLILMAGYLATGVFVVPQHERAFVLIFGKPAGEGADRIRQPGLHWTWPKPFSEIVRIETERVREIDTNAFWFEMPEGSRIEELPPPNPQLDPAREGYTLTGDANILHSLWKVRYTVSHPEVYQFTQRSPELLLKHILEAAVIETSATLPVDRALTGIEEFRSAVESRVRSGSDEAGLGVRIQGVEIRVYPPRQVAQAFTQVTQSESQRSQHISDARAYAVRTLNQARGEADRISAEGQSARQERINTVQADAAYFKEIYASYKANPELIVERLLEDRLRSALANVEDTYVIPPSNNGKRQLRLLINRSQKSGVRSQNSNDPTN